MSLAAGRLNCRVTIQQKVVVYDELHQPVGDDWADLATVWANVKFLSGIETMKANADISVVRASIQIRFRSDVTPAMRVVSTDAAFMGAVFDIRSVLPDAAKREYVYLVVEAGASNG